jgi:cytochrome c-type biogenesis protein CcmH/NrfG
VWDSLAEAYANNGEKDLAIKDYERSIQLNPDNKNGIKQLEKLKQ